MTIDTHLGEYLLMALMSDDYVERRDSFSWKEKIVQA